MSVTQSWVDQPALIWDEQLVQTEDGVPSCAYWNTWEATALEGSTIKEISYRNLFLSAAAVVARLQLLLNQEMNTDEPIIVVAIPEGPLLPLAILAIHALNWTSDAILVPLEPSEAIERNQRILDDLMAAPSNIIILGCSGTSDFDHLMKLVEGKTNQVLLLDFINIHQEAMMDHDFSICETFFKSSTDGTLLEKWSLQKLIGTMALTLSGESVKDALSITKNEQISHIVYTSGTTGKPKGCISSIKSLQHYFDVKNQMYSIDWKSRVFLASALSFDPCLSDNLATFHARGTLAIVPRARLLDNLASSINCLQVSHLLCTPTLWSMVESSSESLKSLEVIALGGEPIPRLIQQRWARSNKSSTGCRLYATYGVTEACVYQTAGEIILDDEATFGKSNGQYVGAAFPGLSIRICQENEKSSLVDVSDTREAGEVVLSGMQLDACSKYWRRPELTSKFITEINSDGSECVYYKTGDRGVFNIEDGTLRILGRIDGAEGMVKVNGVRIELDEIEAAVVDATTTTRDTSFFCPLVIESCMVKISSRSDEKSTGSEVYAYCVLSDQALFELGLPKRQDMPKEGILVTFGVLLTLLRTRCTNLLKAACLPNAYVILPNLPLSPTGKRSRSGLPSISDSTPLYNGKKKEVLLKDYGRLGEFLADLLCECLNLQPLQQEMLTVNVTLDMMGGDSLAATRIIRALYAYHHQLDNSRYLGGSYGKFDGVFNVVHLLRASSFGAYIDMLEQNGIGIENTKSSHHKPETESDNVSTISSIPRNEKPRNALYDALVEAATRQQSSIAIALLHAGADPNYNDHGKRLGKVSGGFFHRKFAFHSSPLHLACHNGDDRLVEHLLHFGANCKSPDAAGLYPLHLAASTNSRAKHCDEGSLSSPMVVEGHHQGEEGCRLRIIQLLLNAGAPIMMRDGNHQTVLHSAARAGHSSILRYVIVEWDNILSQRSSTNKNTNAGESNGKNVIKKISPEKRFVNWQDRWFRSAVHWAILNGHTDALQVALEMGCSPAPYKPKAGKHTSVAMEYPMELCDRLYPEDSPVADEEQKEKGRSMRRLLQAALSKSFSTDNHND